MKIKRVFYKVSMAYCGGHLGTSKSFKRYSDAIEYAKNASNDLDNTDIGVYEYTIYKVGFFKEELEVKELNSFNEF